MSLKSAVRNVLSKLASREPVLARANRKTTKRRRVMGCRVGMTTDLETRKAHWERQYPRMKDWTVHKRNLSYDDAQDLETKLKNQRNCDGQAGGQYVSGNVWAVYSFNF